jgi:hypothetical protein
MRYDKDKQSVTGSLFKADLARHFLNEHIADSIKNHRLETIPLDASWIS